MKDLVRERRFWTIYFVFCFLMLHPPILHWFSDYYVKSHLLTFGLPSLWLWTWLWLAAAFIGFAVCASKSRIWSTEKYDREFAQGGDAQ